MTAVEIHRTEHLDWLSNAYLVLNRAEGRGVLIDGNGIAAPLLDRVDAEGIDITAILLTHHHADHVVLDAYSHLRAPVFAHPATARLAGLEGAVETLDDGEILRTAGLEIEALHTPGHAVDHIAFVVDRHDCFTADVIFKGTVGGTRAPGATGIGDLRASVERILALPPDTVLHPGHREPTTVADERSANPFVLAWQAEQAPTGEPCTVAGEPAQLLLWGPDYDGTHKAWVRLADGTEHVTGGSQVQRTPSSA
jgi:hydroxyacylglutathione hydrolase